MFSFSCNITFTLKSSKQLPMFICILVFITNQVFIVQPLFYSAVEHICWCTESLLKDFEFSAPIEKQFWCLAIFLKLRSSQRDVLFEFSVRNQVYESAKIPRREINYIGDQKSAKSVTFVIPAISNLIHHYLKVEDSR